MSWLNAMDVRSRASTPVTSRTPRAGLGRAAEILDLALVISLIPLALGVTGLFGYVRGLSG